jgi:hypothetical protein
MLLFLVSLICGFYLIDCVFVTLFLDQPDIPAIELEVFVLSAAGTWIRAEGALPHPGCYALSRVNLRASIRRGPSLATMGLRIPGA